MASQPKKSKLDLNTSNLASSSDDDDLDDSLIVEANSEWGTSSSEPDSEPEEKEVKEPSREFIKANQNFACSIYRGVCTGGRKTWKNLVISPFSLHTALAMLWSGAEGETKEELWKCLKFTGDEDKVKDDFRTALANFRPEPGTGDDDTEDVDTDTESDSASDVDALSDDHSGCTPASSEPEPDEDTTLVDKFSIISANRLFCFWTDLVLFPAFEDDILKYFEGSATVEDLEPMWLESSNAAAREVNEWVEKKTRKKVKHIINRDFLEQEGLVIVSGVYFEGAWAKPFLREASEPGSFHIDATTQVERMMMVQSRAFGFIELPEVDATAIELPYRGARVSMIIIRPNRVDGLRHIQNNLETILKDGQSLFWLRPRRVYRDFRLSLPKFKIASCCDNLVPILNTLGVFAAFDEEDADFGGITELAKEEDVHVTAIVHKVIMRVDERGTGLEAEPFSGFEASKTMGRPAPPPDFKVDRPFYFQIVDMNNDGMVLFAGHCSDPIP